MIRDNFQKGVKELVQKRVAGRCSNPVCRVQTIGPSTVPLAVVNHGQAAHIHAAAPGGPRYRPDMTSRERKGVENAIWLCANCATKIDRDVNLYTAVLLQDWKQKAELRARDEQGMRLPEATDAQDQLISAFRGIGRKFIPEAIGNVHRASVASLESLDTRFTIQSEFTNGISTFHIFAKEEVNFSAKMTPELARAWSEGIAKVINHGRSVSLPMQGVTLEGSKLIEALLGESEEVTLTVIPQSQPVVIRLVVPLADGIHSEELPGRLTRGNQCLRFECAGYGGLIEIEFNINRLPDNSLEPLTNISLKFERWQGRNAKSPPYLDKLLQLLQCLAQRPQDLKICFEIEGERVLTGKNLVGEGSDDFSMAYTIAQYAARARAIARYFNVDVPISCEAPLTIKEHKEVADLAYIVENGLKYERQHLRSDPLFNLLVTERDEALEKVVASGEFTTVQQRQEGRVVKLYGTNVELPPMTTTLLDVRLHVESEKTVDNLKELTVRAEMGPKFECKVEFQGDVSAKVC